MTVQRTGQVPARVTRVSFWVTAAIVGNAAVWLALLLVTVGADAAARVGSLWTEARTVIQRDPSELGRAMPAGRCENCGYDLRGTHGPCPQCASAAPGDAQGTAAATGRPLRRPADGMPPARPGRRGR